MRNATRANTVLAYTVGLGMGRIKYEPFWSVVVYCASVALAVGVLLWITDRIRAARRSEVPRG